MDSSAGNVKKLNQGEMKMKSVTRTDKSTSLKQGMQVDGYQLAPISFFGNMGRDVRCIDDGDDDDEDNDDLTFH